jgi:flagellar operon protein
VVRSEFSLNRINQYNPILPPDPINTTRPNPSRPETEVNFKEVLRQKISTDTLKISSHCQKRLEQNNIQLDQQQMDKLNSAVDKAAIKGSRESCVIMKDMVFIVNIPNRTVKTVVDGQRMKDNVFTNIDSAVIV